MTQDLAQIIIIVGATLGVVAWFFAWRCHGTISRMPDHTTQEKSVRGTRAEHIIKTLLRNIPPQCLVTDKTDDTMTVRVLGSTAKLSFQPEPDGVALKTDIDFTKLARICRWIMAAFVFVLQPVVVIGVTWLLFAFVVPSERGAVRWQALQILQISHVLWPPFLIYYLYRRFRREITANIAHLAVLAETLAE